MMQKSCSNLVYVETSSAQLEFFLCNRFFLVNKARTKSKHINTNSITTLPESFSVNVNANEFASHKENFFDTLLHPSSLQKKKRRLQVKRSLYDPFVENAVTATESQLSRRSVSVRQQRQGSL